METDVSRCADAGNQPLRRTHSGTKARARQQHQQAAEPADFAALFRTARHQQRDTGKCRRAAYPVVGTRFVVEEKVSDKHHQQRLESDNDRCAGGGSVFQPDKLKQQGQHIVDERHNQQRLPFLTRNLADMTAAGGQCRQRGNQQAHADHQCGIDAAINIFGGNKRAAPDNQGKDLVKHSEW